MAMILSPMLKLLQIFLHEEHFLHIIVNISHNLQC
jgi:hypothetical protein